MEIRYQDDRITFEKELTVLDELAIDFSEILQEEDIDHVFVAGYVAILFGRSRVSEDIDLIVEKMPKEDFLSLWDSLEGYYCHNTSDPVDAYDRYLEEDIAVRFSEEDTVIPNVEFKFASTGQQGWVLDEKITVELDDSSLPIANMELEKDKERNLEQRMEFIDEYAEWVKKTPNGVWSKQQKRMIDSVLKSADKIEKEDVKVVG